MVRVAIALLIFLGFAGAASASPYSDCAIPLDSRWESDKRACGSDPGAAGEVKALLRYNACTKSATDRWIAAVNAQCKPLLSSGGRKQSRMPVSVPVTNPNPAAPSAVSKANPFSRQAASNPQTNHSCFEGPKVVYTDAKGQCMNFNSLRDGGRSYYRDKPYTYIAGFSGTLSEMVREQDRQPFLNSGNDSARPNSVNSNQCAPKIERGSCSTVNDPRSCISFDGNVTQISKDNSIVIFKAKNSCSEKISFEASYLGCGEGGSSESQMQRALNSTFNANSEKDGFGGSGICEFRCGCKTKPRVQKAKCIAN